MATRKQSPAMSKSVTATLQGKGETLEELVRRAVFDAVQPFVAKLNEMGQKVDSVESEVKAIKETATGAEQSAHENAVLMKATSKEVKLLENQIIGLQVDCAQTVLRLQNVKEEQSENLKDLVSGLLAPFAKATKEEIKNDILEVRRTSSKYAMKRQLPREIIIDFSSKKTRDTILYNSYNVDLDYLGNKVKILKDVPFLARKRRFKYKGLAASLRKCDIKYKWLFPEGVWFRYKDQTYKITSEAQLTEFLFNHQEFLQEESSKSERESGGEERAGAAAPAAQRELRPRRKGGGGRGADPDYNLYCIRPTNLIAY
ncbi:uncharacterized protein LOC129343057 isoform X1 [Eublepharis macularius]|uniref:Uncharacterized protein LOC129343057 isoform X1 n=1 Tax=Eublepharis macularius TaxID=481883 RepID=A0AA97KF75_EUBMA|nr:uncharacterized protein LOC129343057 isoform X1 [Eublepharis macularius]XP_054855011.1 uncharacterized protein LOC129343057 isoform X1 [Eublepharis macularius]